jgi:hypothetical protein
MNTPSKTLTILIIIFTAVLTTNACSCQKSSSPKTPHTEIAKPQPQTTLDTKTTDAPPLEKILTRLYKQTEALKTYQADIRYLLTQDPELLDSKTWRKGKLYYQKTEKTSSLRINFDTVKYDDNDEEEYFQQFILDKGWLKRVDYQLKKIDAEQLQKEGAPFDAFEFISRNFPLIGFTNTQQLQKQFDITLKTPFNDDPNEPIQLEMIVKKGSKYEEDYKKIEFWIDAKIFLPKRMVTISTNDDIYDIFLLDIKANKILKNNVFKLETPTDFSKNIKPLRK